MQVWVGGVECCIGCERGGGCGEERADVVTYLRKWAERNAEVGVVEAVAEWVDWSLGEPFVGPSAGCKLMPLREMGG